MAEQEEDGVRTIRPVTFLNDPRLPMEGIRDFTAKPTNAGDTPPAGPGPRNISSVYGGKRAPTADEPVVLDPKQEVKVPVQHQTGEAGEVGPAESAETGDQPGDQLDRPEQSGEGNADETGQTGAKPSEKREKQEATLSDGDDDSAADKEPQTPAPQTSEPTNAEVKPSSPKTTSGSTDSSSKTSRTKSQGKGTTKGR